MTCSICNGLVEWRNLTSIFGASRICLRCSVKNGPVFEDQEQEEDDDT
jgi:hypothetical protein